MLNPAFKDDTTFRRKTEKARRAPALPAVLVNPPFVRLGPDGAPLPTEVTPAAAAAPQSGTGGSPVSPTSAETPQPSESHRVLECGTSVPLCAKTSVSRPDACANAAASENEASHGTAGVSPSLSSAHGTNVPAVPRHEVPTTPVAKRAGTSGTEVPHSKTRSDSDGGGVGASRGNTGETPVPLSAAAAPTAPASSAPAPRAPAGGIVSTERLSKTYGRREVVHEVNISVRAGEVVGLLGPNGAGKTTSFYMIVGLIPATSGRVFLDGRDITRLPMWQRSRLGLGYLPQEASIFRKLTVWENVMAIVETMAMSAPARKEHTAAMLAELGLTHLARQPAYTLSGGERRRLEIARALATRPRFMLLDEPFSGVDPISVADVQNIVRELKHRGIGVLITDHNVRETLSIVDRAYLIHQGRVFVEGTSDFVINDPMSRKFYLGESFKM